jgi:hypothetical protein
MSHMQIAWHPSSPLHALCSFLVDWWMWHACEVLLLLLLLLLLRIEYALQQRHCCCCAGFGFVLLQLKS